MRDKIFALLVILSFFALVRIATAEEQVVRFSVEKASCSPEPGGGCTGLVGNLARVGTYRGDPPTAREIDGFTFVVYTKQEIDQQQKRQLPINEELQERVKILSANTKTLTDRIDGLQRRLQEIEARIGGQIPGSIVK